MGSKVRRYVAAFMATMAIALGLVLYGAQAPAEAVNDFDIAKIADEAETYADGAWGGWCKEFINSVVSSASGGTISTGGGYHSAFAAAGGAEVSAEAATRGDVIQITPTGSTDATAESYWMQGKGKLHTAIILRNDGNGSFWVIDSNWRTSPPELAKTVYRHQFNPYAWAAGDIIKIWRLGRASGSTGSGGTSNGEDGLFHGVPADGMIVENIDGGHHLYVAAGGVLFWFDRNNSELWGRFLQQMKDKHGQDTNVLNMTNDEVHVLEANWPNPASKAPRDNTVLYEVDSTQQYIAMYQKLFPITVGEVDYLNARDRAVIVPWGSIGPFLGPPVIPNDVLLKDVARPRYHHVVANMLYHANNFTVIDCIKTVKGGAVQPVPVSLIDRMWQFGRTTEQTASCSFPGEWALHGPGGIERWHISGANPYVRYRYGSPLALHCRTGSNPPHVQISTDGINQPVEGPVLGCPDNSYVRIRGNGETFRVMNGILHYIPWPAMVLCLTHGHPEVVIDVDGPVIGDTPRGEWAQCEFEGKMLRAPDGRVVWVKDGQRRYVGNTPILNCIKVRANAGDPIDVPWETFNVYEEGATAYCPYDASIRFVKGDGQSEVWRVFTDGTRQHASGFCVSDPFTTVLERFRVHVVPAGEVDGHTHTGTFWATPENCEAIP